MTEAPVRRRKPTTEETQLMDDLKAALGKHPALDADRMLAITAQLVGNLVAVQDQRRYTSAAAMELVAINIEEGNRVAIDSLLDAETGAVC